MSLDALPLLAGNRLFSVEKDRYGLKFLLTDSAGKRTWSAAITDCGNGEFSIAMASEFGIRMQTFKPTATMRLKNGENAPVKIEKQVESTTPYGNTIIARYLNDDDSPTAIFIAYIDIGENIAHSIALCQVNHSSLMFSLSK